MSPNAASVSICNPAAKRRKPLLLLLLPLLISTLVSANLPAQSPKKEKAHLLVAAPYTQLYVFGDSYSDSGSGYLDSNGPTAVAYLAQRLSIPFTWYGDPKYSKTQGLNFAISGAETGARAGRRYPTGEILGVGMLNQVEQFVAFTKTGDIPKIDSATTMFYFAGGLNDRGKPDGYTRTNIESEIDALYAVGARRFMVALLPTKIPQFATAGIAFNPELAKIPAEERAAHPDIRIANSNWGPFFDEVITNPATFGITDTTHTFAGRAIHHEDTTPCASPDTYFFYHSGHPSTAAHRAVGDMLYKESLTAAP
jgi:phospholipase/lecithinase/hemolysin